MASRLYPGFGSGKGTFEGHFDVRSFASMGASHGRTRERGRGGSGRRPALSSKRHPGPDLSFFPSLPARAGQQEMEASDKIILPPSAFKEINRLKLPFPLTFRVTNERMKTANTVRGIEEKRTEGPDCASRATPRACARRRRPTAASDLAAHPTCLRVRGWARTIPLRQQGPKTHFPLPIPLPQVPGKDGKMPAAPPEQYCGVIEFSAPEGTALMPSWMVQNLKMGSGVGKAAFTTVRNLPRGQYIKLQPYSKELVELAAAIGPRELLEEALRRYSALSFGERIMVEVAGERHFLDVIDIKPMGKEVKGISIYGDVDLEVDFAPIKGSPDDIAEAKEKAAASGSAKDKATAAAKEAAAEAADAKAVAAAAARVKAALVEAKGGVNGALAAPASSTGSAKEGAAGKGVGKGGAAPSSPSRPSPSGKPQPGALLNALAAANGTPKGAGAAGSTSPSRASASKAGPASALKSPSARGGVAASPSGVPATADLFSLPMLGGLDFSAPMVAGGGEAAPDFSSFVPAQQAVVVGAAAEDAAAAEAPPAFSGAGFRLGTTPSSPAKKAAGALSPSRAAALQQQQPAKDPLAERRAAAAERAARMLAAVARQQATAEVDARWGAEGEEKAAPSTSSAPAVASPTRATVQEGWMSSAARERRVAEIVSGAASVVSGPSSPSRAGLAAAAAAAAVTAPAVATAASLLVAESRWEDAKAAGGGKEADAEDALADDPSSSPSRRCRLCLSEVPRSAFDLHEARCRRNPAYHKSTCGHCGVSVFKKDAPRHVHCSACGSVFDMAAEGITPEAAAAVHAQVCEKRTTKCECGAEMPADALTRHRDACPSARESCRYCKVLQKRSLIGAHEERCGSRTAACELCSKLVVLKNMATHVETCTGPVVAAPAPAPAASERKEEAKGADSDIEGEGKEVEDDDEDDDEGEGKRGEGRSGLAGRLAANATAYKKTVAGASSSSAAALTRGGKPPAAAASSMRVPAKSRAPAPADRPATADDPELKTALVESARFAREMERAKAAGAELEPGIQEVRFGGGGRRRGGGRGGGPSSRARLTP
jgi:hypothetical protein